MSGSGTLSAFGSGGASTPGTGSLRAQVIDPIARTPEYNQFIAELNRFHDRRNTNEGCPAKTPLYTPEPMFGGHLMDLYTLYQRVRSHGGYEVVTEKRLWRAIADTFELADTCTNRAYLVKRCYQRCLVDYEFEVALGRPPRSRAEYLESAGAKAMINNSFDEGGDETTEATPYGALTPHTSIPPGAMAMDIDAHTPALNAALANDVLPMVPMSSMPPIMIPLPTSPTSPTSAQFGTANGAAQAVPHASATTATAGANTAASAASNRRLLTTGSLPSNSIVAAAQTAATSANPGYGTLLFDDHILDTERLALSLRSMLPNEIDWALATLLYISRHLDPAKPQYDVGRIPGDVLNALLFVFEEVRDDLWRSAQATAVEYEAVSAALMSDESTAASSTILSKKLHFSWSEIAQRRNQIERLLHMVAIVRNFSMLKNSSTSVAQHLITSEIVKLGLMDDDLLGLQATHIVELRQAALDIVEAVAVVHGEQLSFPPAGTKGAPVYYDYLSGLSEDVPAKLVALLITSSDRAVIESVLASLTVYLAVEVVDIGLLCKQHVIDRLNELLMVPEIEMTQAVLQLLAVLFETLHELVELSHNQPGGGGGATHVSSGPASTRLHPATPATIQQQQQQQQQTPALAMVAPGSSTASVSGAEPSEELDYVVDMAVRVDLRGIVRTITNTICLLHLQHPTAQPAANNAASNTGHNRSAAPKMAPSIDHSGDPDIQRMTTWLRALYVPSAKTDFIAVSEMLCAYSDLYDVSPDSHDRATKLLKCATAVFPTAVIGNASIPGATADAPPQLLPVLEGITPCLPRYTVCSWIIPGENGEPAKMCGHRTKSFPMLLAHMTSTHLRAATQPASVAVPSWVCRFSSSTAGTCKKSFVIPGAGSSGERRGERDHVISDVIVPHLVSHFATAAAGSSSGASAARILSLVKQQTDGRYRTIVDMAGWALVNATHLQLALHGVCTLSVADVMRLNNTQPILRPKLNKIIGKVFH
ncbi:hypothetical protein GQ42DRAFT_161259, partial [Ramicandelaber brevisporus]